MAAAVVVRRRSPALAAVLRRHFAASFSSEASVEHFDPTPSSPPPPPPPSTPTRANPFTAVISAIRKESDPERVAELFRSAAAGGNPRFHSQRPLFALAVRKLARARRPDLIEALLSPFFSDPSAPKSEGYFVRLISLYSSAGLPNLAADAFARVPDPRTDKSLSALLSAYYHNRRYDEVVDAFNRAPAEFNIVPGLISHNILLQALAEKCDLGASLEVLDEMRKKGIVPDIISYNMVLNACLKKRDDDQFEGILKETSSKGLEPNVTTYNYRILKLCGKKETFKAGELLDVMVTKDIQPNLITFNTIIGGFCKEGKVDSAVKMFKRMRLLKRKNGKEGIDPNVDTYAMLIRALVEKGDLNQALDFCKECLSEKFVPPFDVVKGLVDGLAKDSKIDEAKDIVTNMRMLIRGDAVDAWKKIEDALSLQ